MQAPPEWGKWVQVDGVRPAWLDDDDIMWGESILDSTWYDQRVPQRAGDYYWGHLQSIRLPADHWAYPVLDAGFEPWAGGNAAPADWDTKEVLFRSGNRGMCSSWTHPWDGSGTKLSPFDVIGYRKRVKPTLPITPPTVEPTLPVTPPTVEPTLPVTPPHRDEYGTWDHPEWIRVRTRELVERSDEMFPESLRKSLLDHVQTHETDPTVEPNKTFWHGCPRYATCAQPAPSDPIDQRAEELFTVAYGGGWWTVGEATRDVWRRVARHVS